MAILILIFIYSSLSLNERIIEFTKIEKSRIEFTFFVLQASLSSSLFSKEISNFLSGTHKIPSLSFALFINNENRFSVKCQHFTEASVSQACRTYYLYCITQHLYSKAETCENLCKINHFKAKPFNTYNSKLFQLNS